MHQRLGNAADFLHLVRGPFRQNFFPDLVHPVDAVMDVLLVFPAVLEDVVEQAEQEGNVGAGTDADKDIGLRRGSREARVDDDHPCAGFLCVQHVQH